jgi:insulysin
LTLEKLEAFIPQLMSMLHVECLVHGNMDKESALNLVNLVEKKLAGNTLPLLPQHLLRYRDMRLVDGKFVSKTNNLMI